MAKAGNTLDEAALTKTLFSVDDLKAGQQYDGIITELNYAHSHPLQVAVSAFVKGAVSFEKIVDAESLMQEGSSILQKFKVGIHVKAFYCGDGAFSIIQPSATQKADRKLAKGDLTVVRFVKGVTGKGVTV